jgi:hypothetical protein
MSKLKDWNIENILSSLYSAIYSLDCPYRIVDFPVVLTENSRKHKGHYFTVFNPDIDLDSPFRDISPSQLVDCCLFYDKRSLRLAFNRPEIFHHQELEETVLRELSKYASLKKGK